MTQPMQHLSPFSVQMTDTFEGSLGTVYHFYISGSIDGPEEYTDWFQKIRSAGPEDIVVLHINSMGGVAHTAIQFMRVLAETKARVVASAEGACMSAATLLFLSAHQFEISPHCSFMFHNYSGFAGGKGGEIHDQVAFERKWSEGLFRDVYKDFLTTAEIDQMLNGKDIWMDSNEVVKRLKLKAEKMEAEGAKVAPKKVKKKVEEIT